MKQRGQRVCALVSLADGKFSVETLASIIRNTIAAAAAERFCTRCSGEVSSSSSAVASAEAALADCLARVAVFHVHSTPDCVAAVQSLLTPSRSRRARASPSPLQLQHSSLTTKFSTATNGDGAALDSRETGVAAGAPPFAPTSGGGGAETRSAALGATAAPHSATVTLEQHQSLGSPPAQPRGPIPHGPVALLVLDSLAAFYWQDRAWRNAGATSELAGKLGEALGALITRFGTRVIITRPVLFGPKAPASAAGSVQQALRTPVPALSQLMLLQHGAAAAATCTAAANLLPRATVSSGGGVLATPAASHASICKRIYDNPSGGTAAASAAGRASSSSSASSTVAPGSVSKDSSNSCNNYTTSSDNCGGIDGWYSSPHVDATALADALRSFAPFALAKQLLPRRSRSVMLTRMPAQGVDVVNDTPPAPPAGEFGIMGSMSSATNSATSTTAQRSGSNVYVGAQHEDGAVACRKCGGSMSNIPSSMVQLQLVRKAAVPVLLHALISDPGGAASAASPAAAPSRSSSRPFVPEQQLLQGDDAGTRGVSSARDTGPGRIASRPGATTAHQSMFWILG